MRDQFIKALKTRQNSFSMSLTDVQIERLTNYYDLVREQNEFLNLIAPTTGEDFAVRHVLESLTLLEYLPRETIIADVGTGAGLPSIPCLLVREDLKAALIETKEKKAKFLDLAIEFLKINDRTAVINTQFQEVDLNDSQAITCRALDKFTEKLPRLIKWAGKRKIILFGGENLKTGLQNEKARFTQKLLPLSEQRFLFVVEH